MDTAARNAGPDGDGDILTRAVLNKTGFVQQPLAPHVFCGSKSLTLCTPKSYRLCFFLVRKPNASHEVGNVIGVELCLNISENILSS